MILYNITVIIDEGVEKDWLQWVRQVFIPKALSTNLLVSNRILKVLDSPNEGVTYCLQFIADNINSYNEFRDSQAPALLESHTQQFQNNAVYFSTIMEFIS